MPEPAYLLDASCLIVLYEIGETRFLEHFENLVTTPQVVEEYEVDLPSFIEIKHPPKNLFKILNKDLGKGEASIVALGLHSNAGNILVLDDLKARKYAKNAELNVTGTFGLIAKAQKEDKITNGMAIIEKIQTTNFRISEQIVQQIRKELSR